MHQLSVTPLGETLCTYVMASGTGPIKTVRPPFPSRRSCNCTGASMHYSTKPRACLACPLFLHHRSERISRSAAGAARARRRCPCRRSYAARRRPAEEGGGRKLSAAAMETHQTGRQVNLLIPTTLVNEPRSSPPAISHPTCSEPALSRPEVGSSSRMMDGSAAISMPMFTRLRCPPEIPRVVSSPMSDSRTSSSPRTLITRSAKASLRSRDQDAGRRVSAANS